MTTNIQTFSGNVGIGTNDPGSFKLNVNGTVSATSLTVGGITNSEVPSGLIAMWSGALDSLPTGWKICDGTESTPNLANKFILGSEETGGGDPTVGQSGGDHAPNITADQLPTHTHSIGTQGNHGHSSGNAGGHQHYCKGVYGKEFGVRGSGVQNNLYSRQGIIVVGGTAWGNNSNIINNQVRAGPVGNHTHSVNAGGEHDHGGDTGNNTTNAATFDNRPAYYVLAFIMKI
jgi:microcystin-dependent protein